jgi:hypothetical protein
MLVHLLYQLEVEHALGLPHNSPTNYMDTHGWCVHCPLPDWQCVNVVLLDGGGISPSCVTDHGF